MRSDVANNHLALIDADSHAQSHSAFFTPFLIEIPQFSPHAERRARTILCVLRHAKAPHVAPDRHNRVAYEFIECSASVENDRCHSAEVFIELRDQRLRIRSLSKRGEAYQIRKQ